MSDDANKERLEALEARIDQLKGAAAAEKPRGDEHYSAASQGWRMVTELVAGLGIGVSLGYGLDWLFGTIPIFLVLFTLLGFAAGVNVMLRTAKEFEEQPQPEPGSTEDKHDGG